MSKFSIAPKIYTKKSIDKTKKKVELLGVNCKLDPIKFLNFRLISTIILFFIILLLIDNYGYIYAPILSILYYIGIYYYVIDYQIKKRIRTLENEAVYFFEVLTLSVEAGRNLKTALEVTCDNIDSELSLEFRKALSEINYSKTLEEALDSMRKRIPSGNVNNIILNISETAMFGGNVIETLYNQIDFLADKRLQDIRSKIAKLPIKISVISVLFFVPLMLLLILGPVIISVMTG